MKVWGESGSLGAGDRNSGANLSKEVCRETTGIFTESAGNLEKPGLSRWEPTGAGRQPAGQGHVSEIPTVAKSNFSLSLHLDIFPPRV